MGMGLGLGLGGDGDVGNFGEVGFGLQLPWDRRC